MKRWCATLVAVLLASVPVLADVTITTTITMTGGAAAMAGGAAAPRMVMRIKGNKGRSDVETGSQVTSSIIDLVARQLIMLEPATRTARIIDNASKPASPNAPMPKIDATTKPTGRSREIDGRQCDEHSIAMSMDMSAIVGASGQMPPEAAEMMKGIRLLMNGSVWVARTGTGMAEYLAFQKALQTANMTGTMAAGVPGFGNAGLDKVMAASSEMTGLPYLTEITMDVEGSGQMVEMMRQMASMQITVKVTDVSTDTLSEDVFRVPADFKVVK
jgi:hypothetical protein